MEVIAAVSLSLALFLASRAILRRAPSTTRSRLDQIASGTTATSIEAPTFSQRLVQPLVAGLRQAGAGLLPDHVGRWVERELATAGLRPSPASFITITVCTTLGFGGFVAYAVISADGLAGGLGTLLALASVTLGLAGPIVWLRGRASRRRDAIQRALPDTLDLIVVSVEAGLGFEAAVQRITDQGDGPLVEELRRVLADMNLGIARRDAMQAMALRARAPGVTSLVAAILQAERTGMGIGAVLRSQASHLRTQRRQRAEEAAMKAPLKMLFPLIFFIFPALFVVVLGPAVLNLMRTLGGD